MLDSTGTLGKLNLLVCYFLHLQTCHVLYVLVAVLSAVIFTLTSVIMASVCFMPSPNNTRNKLCSWIDKDNLAEGVRTTAWNDKKQVRLRPCGSREAFSCDS